MGVVTRRNRHLLKGFPVAIEEVDKASVLQFQLNLCSQSHGYPHIERRTDHAVATAKDAS